MGKRTFVQFSTKRQSLLCITTEDKNYRYHKNLYETDCLQKCHSSIKVFNKAKNNCSHYGTTSFINNI